MKRTPDLREALAARRDVPARQACLAVLVIRDFTLEPVFEAFLRYFGIYFGDSVTVTYVDLAVFEPFMAKESDYLILCLSDWEPSGRRDMWKGKVNAFLERFPSLTKPLLLLNWGGSPDNRFAASIQVAPLLERLGAERLFDPRGYYRHNGCFSTEGCRELAFEAMAAVNRLRGGAIKCIALDCDNVLWGGEAGELEPGQLELGQLGGGQAYQDFQRELLSWQAKGVLLVLLSKNDEPVVRRIFDGHPDMVLRWEHISSHRVNWLDKPGNLISIARELNLAADHFLLIDDSPVEIALMRELLPAVKTLQVEEACAWKSVPLLRRCGWLPGSEGLVNPPKAEESAPNSLNRGALYAQQKERALAETEAHDPKSFLQSLGTAIRIAKADDFHLPRLAELSTRANQFNLTGMRYTQQELQSIQGDPGRDLYFLRARDRFGDMGIVCFAVVAWREKLGEIETYFLSCRAFGRQFEDALLASIANAARKRGCDCLLGRFVPSGRNQRFASFWPDHGFEPRNGCFAVSLDRPWEIPDHFQEIEVAL